MDEARLKELFLKYIEHTITKQEREEFYRLAADPAAIEPLEDMVQQYNIPKDFLAQLPESSGQKILNRILEPEMPGSQAHQPPVVSLDEAIKVKQKRHRLKMFTVAAAAILAIVLAGYYFFNLFASHPEPTQLITGNQIIKDAMPGHAGALLSLSDGRTFLLDTAINGTLTRGIDKSEEGLKINQDTQTSYATLTTPYGREQRLTLSDGTIAWLNAGSSIHFPLAFKGNTRQVEITGEVYFEVVHNSRQPFIVKAGKEEIKDLGTHFNVRAYPENPEVQTTLLEGKVQIGAYVLNPGQQYEGGKITQVDPQNAIAWVNGYFRFEQADIKDAMLQIARWYNVEIEYEGALPRQKFQGELQRSLKLSQVLRLVAGTGIHYTLTENKLIIRN